jgi:hypothetical protein
MSRPSSLQHEPPAADTWDGTRRQLAVAIVSSVDGIWYQRRLADEFTDKLFRAAGVK